MNKIVVYFRPCTPAPTGGYELFYRVAGSGAPYTNAGIFFISPAIFYDNVNPAGTCYEGYVRTICAGVLGNHIMWESCGSGEPCDNSSCDTTIAIITDSLTYENLGFFPLNVCGPHVALQWATYDRPNRFTVYEDGVVLLTSGWMGYAPYPGPWGPTLNTLEYGVLNFDPIPGRVYQVLIEVGPAGPPPYNMSDNFALDIRCS